MISKPSKLPHDIEAFEIVTGSETHIISKPSKSYEKILTVHKTVINEYR